MRPSLGLVPVEGLVTSIKYGRQEQFGVLITDKIRSFDIPGLLGRDLYQCKDFIAHWYTFKQSVRTDVSFVTLLNLSVPDSFSEIHAHSMG